MNARMQPDKILPVRVFMQLKTRRGGNGKQVFVICKPQLRCTLLSEGHLSGAKA
jgi:hypothetical protein